MTDDARQPFELATAELRKLGITLARLPGEYRVNFQNANDATARTLETLDDGTCRRPRYGRRASRGPFPIRGRGSRRRRPRRMTPKHTTSACAWLTCASFALAPVANSARPSLAQTTKQARNGSPLPFAKLPPEASINRRAKTVRVSARSSPSKHKLDN